MGEIKVNDKGDLRKYFVQIPNLIDDLDLSVYAFRLYVHLKRVAGDSGKCWQSTRTLADECGMSTASVSRAKEELADKELITITKKPGAHGGLPYHEIEIVDIWPKNFTSYSEKHQVTDSKLQDAPEKLASYPGDTKEELFKNKKEEEEEPPPASRSDSTADITKAYAMITSQIAIPYNEKDRVLHNMGIILDLFEWDIDRAVAKGKDVYAEWCNTRSQKSGKHYRRTNSNWTEWWVERLAPEPEEVKPIEIPTPSIMCAASMMYEKKLKGLSGHSNFGEVLQEYKEHLESCNLCNDGTTTPRVINAITELAERMRTK